MTLTEECEHNQPFWECEICGNKKLRTCLFCRYWIHKTFGCKKSPKDPLAFYSDFTCKEWRIEND